MASNNTGIACSSFIQSILLHRQGRVPEDLMNIGQITLSVNLGGTQWHAS